MTDEVLACPLCDWTYVRESAQFAESNLTAAPAIAEALGLPVGAMLEIHAHQAMRRDEFMIEDHLKTHGPHDWLPALMEARAAKAGQEL